MTLLAALATSACGARSEPPPAVLASQVSWVSTYPATPMTEVTASTGPATSAALQPPPRDDAALERDVEARLNGRLDLPGAWTPTAGGASYLASDDAVAKDGGVDVIVQFHGATVADDEWRASAVAGLVLSVQLTGYGVAQYRSRFAPPDRLRAMLDDAVKRVGGTHLRRLGLVSWSAGYGAVQSVLSDPGYYAMVDTVVLLDGMHASYEEGLPDEASIAVFERFARDAALGDKELIVTHSAIVPHDYASTTETATMLLLSAGAPRVVEARTNARGMVEWYHADKGGLHVRGYRGDGAKDHLDQARLVGDAVRAFVAPRWTRWALLDEEKSVIEL